MADTAEEVRELAGVWVDDDPKLYRFLLNYAALLEAQPELLRRLRAAEADLNAWKACGSTGTIHQWREDAERWRTAMRLMCGCTETHYTFKIPKPKLSTWDWQDQFTAAIDAARKP